MTDVLSLHIAPEHLALVQRLLREGLPAGATVRVFGSRVTGRVKPYSDLDLLIDAGRRMSLDESGSLAEAFTESDLPWKVDLLDRHGVDEGFLRLIEAVSLPLTLDD